MYQQNISTTKNSSTEQEALDALLCDLDALAFPVQRQKAVASLITGLGVPEVVSRAIIFNNAGRKKCRVPGCTLKGCNLGTHQSYNSGPSDQAREPTRKELGRRAAAALRQIELYGKGSPSSDGVDGFPTLPIEETLDLGARSLFHFFFTNTFDKLARLFRGPSVSNLAEFKQRMLATALASEPYCRSLMLQAQNEQDVSRGEVEESESALIVHTKTLTAFRAQIGLINEKPHPLHIELALLVLCIIITYDYVHDHMDVLKMHWQGMRDLVAVRGGIHCVTMAVAYVIQVDRLCGIFVDEMPTFINPSPESVSMPLLKIAVPRYGAGFRSGSADLTDIDPTVLEYLADASELVEMWEKSMRAKDSKDKRGAEASPVYIHYSRDRLDEQFAIFNAYWVPMDRLERCLLWASRIVEYPCTWSNYTESLTNKLCHKLAGTLQRQEHDILERWGTKLDLFRWVLFALLMNKLDAGMYTWTVDVLRKVLNAKYDASIWPNDWWVDEQLNLEKFVWSNLQYSNKFRSVCLKIEQGHCEKASPLLADEAS